MSKEQAENYANWRKGLMDRLSGQPCRSANGKYLDGWYSPKLVIPEFLTHKQASEIRRNHPKTF